MGGYYYISRKQLLQAVLEKLGISKNSQKEIKPPIAEPVCLKNSFRLVPTKDTPRNRAKFQKILKHFLALVYGHISKVFVRNDAT